VIDRRSWILIVVSALVLGGVCVRTFWQRGKPTLPRLHSATTATFTDVTDAAGIRFRHYSGALGRKYMPETVGSGVGFIDYNNDGRLDLLYVIARTGQRRSIISRTISLFTAMTAMAPSLT